MARGSALFAGVSSGIGVLYADGSPGAATPTRSYQLIDMRPYKYRPLKPKGE